MPFAGLDLHKKEVQAVLLADDGQILLRHRFPATRAALEEFARAHLGLTWRVALEATTNTWAVAALLQPLTGEVVISNPLRTRAIAEAKIKTDRVDAEVLAHLLRLDYLPRVWQPDEETRRLRQQSTARANLVADRTRIKNRIHAVLHQRLIEAPAGDLFSKKNLAWLQALSLDPQGRADLDYHLLHLSFLELEVTRVHDELARHAWTSPAVRLLMTIPGVDFAVAETLLGVFGDITRFRTPHQAAAYLGLVPSTRQSGDHCYHGRITKQGSGHARWMLVQAAQHLSAHPGPLGVFFRRLAKKKSRNVAVVATAHKLVMVAWYILTNNEPYRYSQPDAARRKTDRLRIRATGVRRRGGNPKGQPRPATYGAGQCSRAIPTLDAVYADAGLPPLPAPSPGETRMLQIQHLEDYAARLHQASRVPRVPDKKKPKKEKKTTTNAPDNTAAAPQQKTPSNQQLRKKELTTS